MKVLIIDTDGVGVDFAIRCQMAGHEVRMFLYSRKHPDIGKGLVRLVNNWRDHMKWADLIWLTSNNMYLEELDWYFANGYPIHGTNKASARLEIDREYGSKVMERCGLPCIPFQMFEDYDEAEAYVLKHNEPLVSKPAGDASDKALSYVSKSPADMVYMLRRWKKLGHKGKFMLQQMVKGVEVGVAGWFGPGGWAGCWEESFEHKKYMNDDKGPNTGEMGTAVKYCHNSKLAEDLLLPMTDTLHALGFVGSCDINCIVDEKGTPWPLEFTVRPGWPAFYIHSSLVRGDPCEWMKAALEGEDILKVDYDHAIGVVIALPDFPFDKQPVEKVLDTPYYGINEKNMKHVHVGEVKLGTAPCMDGDKVVEEELFVAAGTYGLVVVGTGDDVAEARKDCYDRIGEIEIPNSPMYRTDIGKRLKHGLPELKKHGYCKEWRYGSE